MQVFTRISAQYLLAAKLKKFELEAKAVAIDGIAIYVNSKLPVQRLTLQQIKEIFTGKITNWKDVGGPDLQITVFSRSPKVGGTVNFFQQAVSNGADFGPYQEIRDTTESLRKVAKTDGGIGFATASEVVNLKTISIKPLPLAFQSNGAFIPPFKDTNINKVNQQAFRNNSYPISRKIYVIIKKDGGQDEQAGIAYANMLLSIEGQKLIEQSGFAPIRNISSK